MSKQLATRRRILFLAIGACLVGKPQIGSGQAADPLPKPAIEYVIGAFDRFPLIALSEMHNSLETKDFVGTLIRHPGFTSTVANIVVEFGNARSIRRGRLPTGFGSFWEILPSTGKR